MSKEHAEKLLDCLYWLARKNNFVAGPRNTPFSAAEATALTYISSGIGATVSEVAELMVMEQSVASRMISRLEKNGHIVRHADPKDKRRAILSLTANTFDIFSRADTAKNERSESVYSLLTEQERERLYYFYDMIADACGVPNPPPRLNEHPCRRPGRRFSTAIGFQGNSVVGFTLTTPQWILLETIATYPPIPCSTANLCTELGISRAVVTYALKKLEGGGYLGRDERNTDGRSHGFFLTEEGKGFRNELLGAGDKFIRACFKLNDDQEVSEFLNTFSKLVFSESSVTTTPVSKSQKRKLPERSLPLPLLESKTPNKIMDVTLLVVDNHEEGSQARAFAVRTLATNALAEQTPARLVDNDSRCYVAKLGEKIIGLCQLRLRAADKYHMEMFLVEQPLLDAVAPSFFNSVVKRKPRGIETSTTITNWKIPERH